MKTNESPAPGESGRKHPGRSIRVPDEDWEKWRAVANQLDLTLSQWLRQVANRAASQHNQKGKP